MTRGEQGRRGSSANKTLRLDRFRDGNLAFPWQRRAAGANRFMHGLIKLKRKETRRHLISLQLRQSRARSNILHFKISTLRSLQAVKISTSRSPLKRQDLHFKISSVKIAIQDLKRQDPT